MNSEIKNYYITNTIYDSIDIIEAKQIYSNSIEWEAAPQVFQGVYKPHWHETRNEAVKYLSGIRDQKLKDLKKLVSQLECEIYVLENLDWENDNDI